MCADNGSYKRAAIADLAKWGREPLDDGRPRAPVIVLTGTELFCSWRISATWKELEGKRKQFAEGHMRLDNLWTFADATQQIYLDLPSRSEEMRQQRESNRASAEKAALAKETKSAKAGNSLGRKNAVRRK